MQISSFNVNRNTALLTHFARVCLRKKSLRDLYNQNRFAIFSFKYQ